MSRGHADPRSHGAADGRSWCRAECDDVLERARGVIAERHGSDVPPDELLPFGALAEADLRTTKRCPPLLTGQRNRDRGGRRSITEKHNCTKARNPNG